MIIFKKSNLPSTTESDIKFLFEMVRKSPYVSMNPDYREKAQNTNIDFDYSNEMINAYAQSSSRTSHRICIYDGICNSSTMMSIALAQFKQDCDIERLKEACRWIGERAINNNGYFTTTDISDGLDNFRYSTDGIVGTEAKSYTAGAIMAVIAHELGHICLSHTLREECSDDVSRNDERQADLFGCNVSCTTPFASHIVMATLFCEILFTWMSDIDAIATTHPHSRERVYNTVNAHDIILKSLGITPSNIDVFLP